MQLLDGIIEKILGGLGTAGVLAGLKAWWNRRRKGNAITPEAQPSKTAPPAAKPVSNRSKDPPPKYLEIGGRTVLNARVAYEAYINAPFLQREDIVKHHIGLIAGTIGSLHSMEPALEMGPGGRATRERTSIHVASDGVSVFTTVTASDFPGLNLLGPERDSHL